MADNKTIERIQQEVVSANKDTLYQATLKDTEQEQYIQHKFPKDFKGGETYNDIFRKETDTEKRERVKRDQASIERVDAQVKR